MGYKIKFSKQAGEDIAGIYDYHANNLKASDQADRITNNIKKAVKSLRVFPFRNTTVKDLKNIDQTEIRSMTQDGYRIFYCVRGTESEIVILTILFAPEKDKKH